MRYLVVLLIFLFAAPYAQYATAIFQTGRNLLLAQNIFDDNIEVPTTPPQKTPEEKNSSKTDTPKKKKSAKTKKSKKNKKRKVTSDETTQSVGNPYTTAALASSSYEWVPESNPFTLRTPAKGMAPALSSIPRPDDTAVSPLTTTADKEKTQSPNNSRLPLMQVLIVAAFAVVFLIYRLSIGRKIKSRKY
ncbi:MAG: hypothetical protein LDLANPLL_00667 [Turneriella sp.]|nr:hypothetical protein [Turneriella sp.]